MRRVCVLVVLVGCRQVECHKEWPPRVGGAGLGESGVEAIQEAVELMGAAGPFARPCVEEVQVVVARSVGELWDGSGAAGRYVAPGTIRLAVLYQDSPWIVLHELGHAIDHESAFRTGRPLYLDSDAHLGLDASLESSAYPMRWQAPERVANAVALGPPPLSLAARAATCHTPQTDTIVPDWMDWFAPRVWQRWAAHVAPGHVRLPEPIPLRASPQAHTSEPRGLHVAGMMLTEDALLHVVRGPDGATLGRLPWDTLVDSPVADVPTFAPNTRLDAIAPSTVGGFWAAETTSAGESVYLHLSADLDYAPTSDAPDPGLPRFHRSVVYDDHVLVLHGDWARSAEVSLRVQEPESNGWRPDPGPSTGPAGISTDWTPTSVGLDEDGLPVVFFTAQVPADPFVHVMRATWTPGPTVEWGSWSNVLTDTLPVAAANRWEWYPHDLQVWLGTDGSAWLYDGRSLLGRPGWHDTWTFMGDPCGPVFAHGGLGSILATPIGPVFVGLDAPLPDLDATEHPDGAPVQLALYPLADAL